MIHIFHLMMKKLTNTLTAMKRELSDFITQNYMYFIKKQLIERICLVLNMHTADWQTFYRFGQVCIMMIMYEYMNPW